MMFWIKKSELHVDAFTYLAKAYELFPLRKASSFYPEWWKKLPKENLNADFYPAPTMKTCTGFIEHYQHGVVMQLWSDVIIEMDVYGKKSFKWKFADEKTRAENHDISQYQGYLGQHSLDFSHLKIVSPWYLYCKEEIPFLFLDVPWQEMNDNYRIMPGTVDLKYQHSTNINLFLRHKEQKNKFMIDAGTPMAHIIPLSEKKLIIHHHLLSEEQYFQKEKENRRVKFIGDNIFVKKASKCPFH